MYIFTISVVCRSTYCQRLSWREVFMKPPPILCFHVSEGRRTNCSLQQLPRRYHMLCKYIRIVSWEIHYHGNRFSSQYWVLAVSERSVCACVGVHVWGLESKFEERTDSYANEQQKKRAVKAMFCCKRYPLFFNGSVSAGSMMEAPDANVHTDNALLCI